jgi:hypothetical protein
MSELSASMMVNVPNVERHTPGPWRYNHVHTPQDQYGHHYFEFVAGRGHSENGFWLSGIVAPADARVIVSAPELLAELERLVERCDGEEGVRADGSNIDTRAANMLLARIRGDR